MNAMSSVALGDSRALKAQYEALQAEMAKIQRALADDDAAAQVKAPQKAEVVELRTAPSGERVRKVPGWLLKIADEAPKNAITLGKWGPAD